MARRYTVKEWALISALSALFLAMFYLAHWLRSSLTKPTAPLDACKASIKAYIFLPMISNPATDADSNRIWNAAANRIVDHRQDAMALLLPYASGDKTSKPFDSDDSELQRSNAYDLFAVADVAPPREFLNHMLAIEPLNSVSRVEIEMALWHCYHVKVRQKTVDKMEKGVLRYALTFQREKR